MKIEFAYIPLLLMVVVSIGCGGEKKRRMTDEEAFRKQQELITANKRHHENEIKEIDEYILQRKWPMAVTPSGLRYWIYEPTQGQKTQSEDVVSLSYTISLLNGETIYETTDDRPKFVRIDHDNVETGLHEALKLMKVGERAKFIFPSYLAYGFTGEAGKVPPNSTILYDIHLISIQ